MKTNLCILDHGGEIYALVMCGSVFRHPKATMCQNHGRAEGSSEHKGKIKIISSNKSGILVIYDFRVKIPPYLVSTSIFGTKLKFGAK